MTIETAHILRPSYPLSPTPLAERPCVVCGLPRNHAGKVNRKQTHCKPCDTARTRERMRCKRAEMGIDPKARLGVTLTPIQEDCIARQAQCLGCYHQEIVESLRPGECAVRTTAEVVAALT